METDKNTKARGGLRCVAGTLDNKSCCNNSKTKGINLHRFPKDPNINRQWVKFVRKRRPNFDPKLYSNPVLCSDHFEASCYTKSLAGQLEGFDTSKTKKFLQRDAVPTIYLVSTNKEEKPKSPSKRERRKVSKNIHLVIFNFIHQVNIAYHMYNDELTKCIYMCLCIYSTSYSISEIYKDEHILYCTYSYILRQALHL